MVSVCVHVEACHNLGASSHAADLRGAGRIGQELHCAARVQRQSLGRCPEAQARAEQPGVQHNYFRDVDQQPGKWVSDAASQEKELVE